jgi:putative ABC transport system ATP-binding protein
MIRIENVSKCYPAPRGGEEVLALDAIDLRIAPGELVAVVGPSGSGKSTLLHAIGGMSAPTSGQVHLGETSVYDLDVQARTALRLKEIGYVFQTFNLVPYLTCLENVVLPARLAGTPRGQARERALAILARLGIADRRAHRPGELSVGERQRVGIARAIVNGPTVLLADEPTGNLDPGSADEVMAILRELSAEGQTVVMVTHDPRLAAQARRTVRLEAGRLAEDSAASGDTAAPFVAPAAAPLAARELAS